MSEDAQRAGPDNLILSQPEVDRRMEILSALRAALEAAGVRCALVRKHRLVLRYNQAPLEPSGLTNPQLHIFSPGLKDMVTTDGLTYKLASGKEFPADDLSVVTADIVRAHKALSPA